MEGKNSINFSARGLVADGQGNLWIGLCDQGFIYRVDTASGEAAEILGMMAQNGFYKQMAKHSTTSQYGTLTRSRTLLNDEIKARMRKNLVEDIKGGAFVKEWSDEQSAGSQVLAKVKKEVMNSPMSQAEDRVISLVQRAHKLNVQK